LNWIDLSLNRSAESGELATGNPSPRGVGLKDWISFLSIHRSPGSGVPIAIGKEGVRHS